MPDVTDCLLLPYPLLTDTPDVPRDIEALAQRVDDLLCGATGDIDELKTQMLLRVRKAGDTMTGTLIANGNVAGVDIRRPGNAPFLQFSNHPDGGTRFGYVQATSAGMRYNADDPSGYHQFVIGTTQAARISAGGIIDAAQVRTTTRLTAGAPSGLQLALVDTQPVAAAPTTYMGFYNSGAVSSLGTRAAWFGFGGTTAFRLQNELVNSPIQIIASSGGDIQITPGANGRLLYGASANTKGAVVGDVFLFGKVASDLNAAGVEIFCGGGVEGSVRSTIASAGAQNFYARHEGASNADNEWFYQCANAEGTSMGGIRANGTTAVELVGTATSDYRVKRELGPLADGLARLARLRPVRYVRTDDDTGRELDGLIAHEVAEVVPQAVSGLKDAVNADGTLNLQEMHGEKLVPLLVAAVQELAAEVSELRAQLGELREGI